MLDIAKIPLRDDFDGTPMPLTPCAMKKAAVSPMHDHVTIEYWGLAGEEGGLTRGGPNGSFSEFHGYKMMLRY